MRLIPTAAVADVLIKLRRVKLFSGFVFIAGDYYYKITFLTFIDQKLIRITKT